MPSNNKIRKFIKERYGIDLKKPKYKEIKHKKIIHEVDPVTGKISLKQVEKIQLINETKIHYRELTKAIHEGKIKMPTE